MFYKEEQMEAKSTLYSEKDIQRFAEFLVKFQVEADGSTKAMPTAINEAKERLEYGDFKVRPANSVDGKEHIFSLTD